MKKWLNEEHVVKRKNWTLIFESVLESFFFVGFIYFCCTDFNDMICEALKSFKTVGVSFGFFVFLFLILSMLLSYTKVESHIINSSEKFKKAKSKKK